MRITGLATGLDMDEIVKSSMQPYRIKIQVQQQQKEILEIKQKLYRDVINDCREFYNKNFDITKSDSILLSKNWSTTKFTSSDENIVSVTSTSSAKPGNYTITGQPATAAKAIVTEIEDSIVINGKEFAITGSSNKEKADNLNKELKKAGINVSVRYSNMAGTEAGNQSGFIFESTIMGEGNSFTIGGGISSVTPLSSSTGSVATAGEFTGLTMDEILNSCKNGTFTINGEEIEITLPEKEDGEELTNDEKLAAINKALKSKNLQASIDETKGFVIKSTTLGELAEDKIPKIKIDGTEITSFTNGEKATAGFTVLDPSSIAGSVTTINGVKVDLTDVAEDDVLSNINKVFSEQNVSITATINDDGNIVLTSKKNGADTGIDVKVIDSSTDDYVNVEAGRDAKIVIKDDKGGVYTHEGNSNTITVDGVTFKINGEIPTSGITVNGKNDVSAVKDKLVSFINDYNTLMVKLNTLTTEKRDSSYMPLTDEQKDAMSESEVKLWNERVEKGQLRRDSDLTRIANSMKAVMRSSIDGNNLSKFGIEPVADYQGTNNGTFTIDENKLMAALEENPEDIMNFFIGTNDDKSKSGIAQQLKTIIYDETVTTSSPLIKKAGIEGSASASDNELTRKISKYTNKMADMEKEFSRKEQALYSQWATIETLMNNLNSQQSYLSSMLG